MRICLRIPTLLGLLLTSLYLFAQPNITRVEYFIDIDPGQGNGIAIPVTESTNVTVSTTLDLSHISDGFHWIYLRGKDADGRWSVASSRMFYKGIIESPAPTSSVITRVEYFFNSDPGFGNGNPIPVTPGSEVQISEILDVSSLTDGFHWVLFRAQDSNGKWSIASSRVFYKGNLTALLPDGSDIIRAEYFFDTDPGFGNGVMLSLTSGDNVSINQEIDVGSLTDGFHWIYFRGMDSKGRWSVVSARLFLKGDLSSLAPEIKNLKRVEYFINIDPGFGNGTPIPITEGTEVLVNHLIDVSTIPDGINKLYIRGMDESGRWSVSSVRVFYKGQYYQAPENSTIKRVEYFIDTDPGFGLATALPFTLDAEVEISAIIDLGSLPEGSHTFAVRVQDSFGRWSYLFTRSFYLDMTPPIAPTGLEVIIGNSQVTLKWRKNSEGDFLRYRIYMGITAGNESLVDSTFGTISDTIKVISGLVNNTNYSFFVTAVDSAMLESTPSNSVNGTPLASAGPPPVPTVYSASNLEQYRFSANWNPSPSAEGYNLDVSTNVNFTTFVTGYNNKDVGNVTSFEVTGLNLNTTYYYRLRAYSSYGTSLNSGTISVTTLLNPPSQPSVPVATNATLISQTGFTANWNTVSNATGYHLDVSADMAFTSILAGYNNRDVGSVTNLAVTGLTKETDFYYRVRAYNSHGTSSNSNTISVRTQPDPPAAPVANTSTDISQTFFTANWSSSPGATGYRLDVATDIGFTAYVAGYHDKDVSNTGNHTVTGLIPDVTYYLRVRSYNTGGVSSNSNVISTKTLVGLPPAPDPPVVLDATGISQTSFSARWNSSAAAAGYRLDVSTDIGFNTIVTGYNNKDVGDATISSVTGLIANNTYYYRVRAYNAGGTSNNSGVVSLTTLPYLPVTPSGLVSSSCYDLVTIHWGRNNEPDFLRYRIFGGPSPDLLEEIELTAPGNRNDTIRVYANVTRGTRYYYSVTAINNLGLESESSNIVSVVANWGVIPKIHIKWNDVLICYNLGDSLSEFQWHKGTEPIPGATRQYYVTRKQPGDYSVLTIDKNGCSDRSNSINVFSAKSLEVFPNPTSGLASLRYEGEQSGRVTISVISETGTKLMQFTEEKPDYHFNKIFSFEYLQSGAYTIELRFEDGNVASARILVIR